MPARKLINRLHEQQIPFQIIEHAPAFTAPEVAQSAHIKGDQLAKAVILDADNQLIMVVVPSSCQLEFDALRRELGVTSIRLCPVARFSAMFPACELGALPPFGNLYGMDTFLANCFDRIDNITFCAGTHSELIQISYVNYLRMVHPTIISEGYVRLGMTPPRMREHTGIRL